MVICPGALVTTASEYAVGLWHEPPVPFSGDPWGIDEVGRLWSSTREDIGLVLANIDDRILILTSRGAIGWAHATYLDVRRAP